MSVASRLQDLLDAARSVPLEPVSGPCVIYGAGGFGVELAGRLERAGAKVVGFIDQAPRSGLPWPVWSLDRAGELPGDATAVIGVFNPAVDLAPIARQLRTRFARVWSPVQVWHRLPAPPARYWMTSRQAYLDRRDEIVEAASFFADDRSRNLYLDLWRYRLTGDVTFARPSGSSTLEDQYFPEDLQPWPVPVRLVDCGAFDGDTIVAATRRGISVSAVVAFEPDPANYAALTRFLGGREELLAIALPCGVAGRTAQVRFASGSGAASAITESGDAVIQCVTLDAALHGFVPTLIKMDIEGAEDAALDGARRIVARDRPGLAISAYHTPEHLWSLAAKVRSWDLGYDIYLRAHGHQGFDTVVYGLPR